jgi:glycosyltransferase involved in cell wall biosynthesis
VLVLAGGGVLHGELRALADSLGIGPRVIMPGPVNREEAPVYFKAADVFAVPSIRHESGAVDGLPVVVPEAMAAGLPIIASRVGGIPLLVHDSVTGLLVPGGDVPALADALRRLLSDPSACRRFGERARKVIESTVNYERIAEYMSRVHAQIARGVAPDRIPRFTLPEDGSL